MKIGKIIKVILFTMIFFILQSCVKIETSMNINSDLSGISNSEVSIMKNLMPEDQLKKEIEKLGLKKEELAFYEALAQNQSARELMGDEVLSKLAKEITDTLRKSMTIDWQYKEGVRARMRILVKRALQRYKYPPDKQEEAVSYVIKQAEEIAEELAQ